MPTLSLYGLADVAAPRRLSEFFDALIFEAGQTDRQKKQPARAAGKTVMYRSSGSGLPRYGTCMAKPAKDLFLACRPQPHSFLDLSLELELLTRENYFMSNHCILAVASQIVY